MYNGFKVVDPDVDIPVYDCANYGSCFKIDHFEKMNTILLNELNHGKLTVSEAKPQQIHALGAVPKPNNGVRHITDCTRPMGASINNYMKYTFSRFSFKTIDDIIKDIKPGCYMATVDLENTYRSVHIHPSDRKHFGLCWDFGSGPRYLTDNFLCFGSKCSPFIFNRL